MLTRVSSTILLLLAVVNVSLCGQMVRPSNCRLRPLL